MGGWMDGWAGGWMAGRVMGGWRVDVGGGPVGRQRMENGVKKCSRFVHSVIKIPSRRQL